VEPIVYFVSDHIAIELSKLGGRFSVDYLGVSGGPRAVGAVDLGVHGQVAEAGREDPVVGVGQDGRERLGRPLPRPVEHLRLQLGELVLQLGEVVGQGVHDARVDGAVDALIRAAEILRALQGGHEVAPEVGLLRQRGVAGVEVHVHLADSGVACHC
jgi:hypothetical protein